MFRVKKISRYVLGFINTGYFTSDNVPDGLKNATHNTQKAGY
jgi:hypothetical protein